MSTPQQEDPRQPPPLPPSESPGLEGQQEREGNGSDEGRAWGQARLPLSPRTVQGDPVVLLHGLQGICLPLEVHVGRAQAAARTVIVDGRLLQRPELGEQLLRAEGKAGRLERGRWAQGRVPAAVGPGPLQARPRGAGSPGPLLPRQPRQGRSPARPGSREGTRVRGYSGRRRTARSGFASGFQWSPETTLERAGTPLSLARGAGGPSARTLPAQAQARAPPPPRPPGGALTWMSASDTPKSRLDTSSFPPVSTPAPPPKPLSNRSCCHLSGSCLGCGRGGAAEEARRERAPLLPARPPARAVPPRGRAADKGRRARRPPGQAASRPGRRPPPRAPHARRAHPAVGRRPVPAAAARRAAGQGRPVPDGPAASAHPRRRRLRAAAAAPAALRAGPAAPPAPAAAAALAPVELDDVVQGHVHLVGHGGAESA